MKEKKAKPTTKPIQIDSEVHKMLKDYVNAEKEKGNKKIRVYDVVEKALIIYLKDNK